MFVWFVAFVEGGERYTIAWEKAGEGGKKREHSNMKAQEGEDDAARSKKPKRSKDGDGTKK